MPAPVENDRAAKLQRIRELNDIFRTTHVGGCVNLSIRVGALSRKERKTIVQKVRDFTEFTSDSDRHGEHNFGSFDHAARKLSWKIEYYSLNMQRESEDPTNPSVTMRVLEIKFADE